jgi:hypothetical protein
VLAIINDIVKLIEHLVERQDVKALAWRSNICEEGLVNTVVVFTGGGPYEVWEHDNKNGFELTAVSNGDDPIENRFHESTDNARYNEDLYVLVCGIPQTSLERAELKIKIVDYITDTFKTGIFAGVEQFWNTEHVQAEHHAAGGDIFMSGMPFYAKNKVGWAWSAGSPIKRAGIVTEISEET